MLTAMERDQFNEKRSNRLRDFILDDQELLVELIGSADLEERKRLHMELALAEADIAYHQMKFDAIENAVHSLNAGINVDESDEEERWVKIRKAWLNAEVVFARSVVHSFMRTLACT